MEISVVCENAVLQFRELVDSGYDHTMFQKWYSTVGKRTISHQTSRKDFRTSSRFASFRSSLIKITRSSITCSCVKSDVLVEVEKFFKVCNNFSLAAADVYSMPYYFTVMSATSLDQLHPLCLLNKLPIFYWLHGDRCAEPCMQSVCEL